jgi:hypothetical protein
MASNIIDIDFDNIQRNPSLVFTKLDNEIVLLNPDIGEYIELNSVASRVWELIVVPISVAEIISTLLEEFDVSEEECTTDTLNCITEFREQKLIL